MIKVPWTINKFDIIFKEKSDKHYLYTVEYFMQTFGLQNNHFSNGPWLAGGTLRRLREGQVYMGADFDIFFKSEDQKNDFIQELKGRGATSKFESEHASTYNLLLGSSNLVVQAIHRRYYNMPSDVIADFDIIACQFITNGIDIIYGKLTLDQVDKKFLRINQAALEDKNYSAISTLRRFIKMGADGYRIGSWHVKEFLEHVKKHPECINEIVSMSPEAKMPDDEPPF